MTDPTALCRRCRHARSTAGDDDMLMCAALGTPCSTARFTACDEGQFFEDIPNTMLRLTTWLDRVVAG